MTEKLAEPVLKSEFTTYRVVAFCIFNTFAAGHALAREILKDLTQRAELSVLNMYL